MKCSIKSFEEFFEKFSADEAEKHFTECSECSRKYGSFMHSVYPDLEFPKVKIKRKRMLSSSPFFRWSVAAAAAIILVTAVIIPFIAQSRQRGSMYTLLNYEDYLDMTASMDEDEVINLLQSIQEEL